MWYYYHFSLRVCHCERALRMYMWTLWSKLKSQCVVHTSIMGLQSETTPCTLLVLPGDDKRSCGFVLTLYPAGLTKVSILRPKGHFPTQCKKGDSRNREKDKRVWKKPRIATYVPGVGDDLNAWTVSASTCNRFCTNFSCPIGGLAKDNDLMNLANPSLGTSFRKASPSQVVHCSSEPEVGAGWVMIHEV
jgi:hypothetical protein